MRWCLLEFDLNFLAVWLHGAVLYTFGDFYAFFEEMTIQVVSPFQNQSFVFIAIAFSFCVWEVSPCGTCGPTTLEVAFPFCCFLRAEAPRLTLSLL